MIDYSKLTPLIVKSIQEMESKINSITLSEMIGEFFGGVITDVTDGVAYMKSIVVGTLEIGSSEKRTGITLYDEITGEPYCLSISGGTTKTKLGECGIITPTISEPEITNPIENIIPPELPTEETLPEDKVITEEVQAETPASDSSDISDIVDSSSTQESIDQDNISEIITSETVPTEQPIIKEDISTQDQTTITGQ
jgi:hypothetical protein